MKVQREVLIIHKDYQECCALQQALKEIETASIFTNSITGTKKIIAANYFHFYIIKIVVRFHILLHFIKKISRQSRPCYILLVDLNGLRKNEMCQLYGAGLHFRLTDDASAKELVERIKRLKGDFTTYYHPSHQSIRMGEFELQGNILTHIPSDLPFYISLRQREVLVFLFNEANSIVTTERLLYSLWGKADVKTKRSMDVLIYKLRRILKNDSSITLETMFKKGLMLKVMI